MTRCKVKCEQVTYYKESASVTLTPVVSGSKENEQFYRWTPGGQIKLDVVNIDVAKNFNPGEEYYVDISSAK